MERKVKKKIIFRNTDKKNVGVDQPKVSEL
jgi:hypothetical protein